MPRRVAGTWLFATASLLGASARADPPRAEVVIADAAAPEALRRVLAELLDRRGVSVRFGEARVVDVSAVLSQPARDELVARAWVELPDQGRARLFVVDAAGERVLVRVVPLERGFDEVARETVAQVVADAIDALAHGAVIGVHRDTLRPREEPRRPIARPVTEVTTPSQAQTSREVPRRWSFGAVGEVQLRGEALAAGGGVVVARSWSWGGWSVGPWLSCQLRAGVSLDAEVFSLRTMELAVRGGVTLRRALGPRVFLEGALGGGPDIVRVDDFASTDARWQAVALDWFAAPVARGQLGLGVRATRSVTITAAAAVEADLSASRYTARAGDARVIALSPWVLRPSVALEISVTP